MNPNCASTRRMNWSIGMVWLVSTLIADSDIALATEGGPTLGERPPHVLLIVADDLGYSDLGCFGGEIQTPHLDRLAEQGLRMTRLYNSARCCPSRAALLTGQYPHRVGLGHMVKDLGRPGYRGRLDDSAVTLGQVLRQAGYRTFMSGKWHLGTDEPTRHGFEEFFGTLVSARNYWQPEGFLRRPADRTPRINSENNFHATVAVTDYALDFLQLARQTPEQPWFLYVAYHAPHFPLHAPADLIRRYAPVYQMGWDAMREKRLERMKELGTVAPDTVLSDRSRYWNWGEEQTDVNPAWDSFPTSRRADLARRMAIHAAMVDQMDAQIGRITRDLQEQGELENTLIIFLSDNGACAEWDPLGFDGVSGPDNKLHRGEDLERMGGPGTYHSIGSGWANASNTPWRLYKHYCHEGGIRTPGVVHWPAKLSEAGRIDHRPGHIVDLLPTLLDVATGSSHGDADGDGAVGAERISLPMPPAGRSLLPLWRGEPVQPRLLFVEHEGNRAVVDTRWKLVAVRGGTWELYDLEKDPTERKDVSANNPEIVERFQAAWDAWAEENQVTPLPGDYGVEYLTVVEEKGEGHHDGDAEPVSSPGSRLPR